MANIRYQNVANWADRILSGLIKRDLLRLFRGCEGGFRLPHPIRPYRRIRNPLPVAFPGFAGQPKADPDAVLAISCDAERIASSLFAGLPLAKQIPHFVHNIDLLLAIAPVSEHLLRLRDSGLEHYYRRALALLLLLQGCIWIGGSDSALRFAPDLPYLMMGVCMRHCAVASLSAQAKKTLVSARSFDLNDPQELRQRDHLLGQIRDIEENLLASRGFKRFLLLAKPTGKNQPANVAAAIVRYSGRLTGRTATPYSRDALWRIPAGVIYLEVLDNVAAAWCRYGKQPLLVLAEEHARLSTATHFTSIGELSSRNRDALSDLLALFGVELLPNFQNAVRPAFYVPAQGIIAKAVVAYSEASRRDDEASAADRGEPSDLRVGGGSHSGRWLAAKIARGNRSRGAGAALDSADSGACVNPGSARFIQWRCFRLCGDFSLENRRKLETVERGHLADPSQEQMLPMDFPVCTSGRAND